MTRQEFVDWWATGRKPIDDPTMKKAWHAILREIDVDPTMTMAEVKGMPQGKFDNLCAAALLFFDGEKE